MWKSLAVTVFIVTSLLGRPCTASVQPSAPVPPTHVIIDPPLPAFNSAKPESANEQRPPQVKPLAWFLRPDFLIVWVTIAYAFISWLTVRATSRQANTMEAQAKDARDSAAAAAAIAQDTLKAINLQTHHTGQQVAIAIESAKTAQMSGEVALEQLKVMQQQAVEMKAQTAVAKTSAEAALLNAKALINAERPWVYPTITIFGPLTTDANGPRLSVRIQLDNLGNTPAVGMVFEPRMYVMHISKPHLTDERKRMLEELANRAPVLASIAFPKIPVFFNFSISLAAEDVETHQIAEGAGYVVGIVLCVVYRHTLDETARYYTGRIYRLGKPLEKGGALFKIGEDVPVQDLLLIPDSIFPIIAA